jgi:phosphohistidine phosphatase
MRLVLVRHAIAEEREAFAPTGRPDDERPLTPEGVRKMRRAARGLHQAIGALDLLATSPLVRARQTAEILAERFAITPVEVPQLAPSGALEELREWVLQRESASTVALVGHEPTLGQFAGLMLCGRAAPLVTFKKGGACLLETGRGAKVHLRWALTPAQLRRLA